MLDRIKQSVETLLEFKTVIALELFEDNGDYKYIALCLKKKKNLLNIVQQIEGTLGDENLKKLLDAGYPVHLLLSIQGILRKKIVDNNKLSPIEKALSAIPGIQISDFYFQVSPLGRDSLVSLVRKNTLDTLLEKIKALDITPYDITLAPFQISFLSNFTQLPPTLFLAGHHVNFSTDGLVESFKKNTSFEDSVQELIVGDDAISIKKIPAYTAALRSLLQTRETLHNFSILEKNESEAIHRYWFSKLKITLLAAVFGILLINTGVYWHFQDKNQAIQQVLSSQHGQLKELEDLRETYENHKQLNGNKGKLGVSRISFYADRLAATLPNSITLKALDVFPKIKTTVENRASDIPKYENKIVVKGQFRNVAAYNTWIEQLGANTWINQVNPVWFKNLDAGLGEFETHLLISPEE